MKDFFRNMDLYKGMILGCMVLLPAAGGWVWWLKGRVEHAEKQVAAARQSKGDLQMIGLLQKQIEKQTKQAQTVIGQDHYRTYIEKCILSSAGGGGIKKEDFEIMNPQPHAFGKNVEDKEVEVKFGTGREKLALPRDFLNYVIYNVESQLPIFKLRKLDIVNKTAQDQQLLRGDKAPPPELADEWYVDRMVFAQRQPK